MVEKTKAAAATTRQTKTMKEREFMICLASVSLLEGRLMKSNKGFACCSFFEAEQNDARRDQQNSQPIFHRRPFLQKDNREYSDQHDAQFIDRRDLGSFAGLQGAKITDPRGSRGQAGQG